MFLDEATHIHHVGVALTAVVAAEVVGSIDGPGDGSIVKPLLQIGIEVFGIGIKGSAEGGNGAEVNDGHGGTVAVVIFHGGLSIRTRLWQTKISDGRLFFSLQSLERSCIIDFNG